MLGESNWSQESRWWRRHRCFQRSRTIRWQDLGSSPMGLPWLRRLWLPESLSPIPQLSQSLLLPVSCEPSVIEPTMCCFANTWPCLLTDTTTGGTTATVNPFPTKISQTKRSRRSLRSMTSALPCLNKNHLHVLWLAALKIHKYCLLGSTTELNEIKIFLENNDCSFWISNYTTMSVC